MGEEHSHRWLLALPPVRTPPALAAGPLESLPAPPWLFCTRTAALPRPLEDTRGLEKVTEGPRRKAHEA